MLIKPRPTAATLSHSSSKVPAPPCSPHHHHRTNTTHSNRQCVYYRARIGYASPFIAHGKVIIMDVACAYDEILDACEMKALFGDHASGQELQLVGMCV
jgi:hypothetical protein